MIVGSLLHDISLISILTRDVTLYIHIQVRCIVTNYTECGVAMVVIRQSQCTRMHKKSMNEDVQ